MQLVEPYPEGDRGALRPADQERIDVLDTRIRSPEVRQLVEQRLDRDARLVLRAIQPQCGFSEGEVRVVSVEGQPLFGPTMHWRVHDPVKGLIAEGHTRLADYVDVQPWPTGRFADALLRRRSA